MKLLFLDFDGVLNSDQSLWYSYWFRHDGDGFVAGFADLCPIACSNLSMILERVPELRIVVSSTWRLYYSLAEFEPGLRPACPAIVGRIIGRTPSLRVRLSQPTERGREIRQWLKDNGHLQTPFVILDDNTDMAGVAKHLVRTDPAHGLQWKDALKVMRRLQR